MTARVIVVAATLLLAGLPAGAQSPPRGAGSTNPQGAITAGQAEQILQELREIRRLLERQNQPQPAAAAPQASNTVRLTLQDDARALGASAAPLVIVEFIDYQCPYCVRYHRDTFPEVRRRYIDTGRARYVLQDLPLSTLHPHAQGAAESVRCAGDQGKLWELRDALLADSRALTPEGIRQHAAAAGVDMAAFDGCTSSRKYQDAVQADARAAAAAGITGTPTFVVGNAIGKAVTGLKLVGAVPISAIENAVAQSARKP